MNKCKKKKYCLFPIGAWWVPAPRQVQSGKCPLGGDANDVDANSSPFGVSEGRFFADLRVDGFPGLAQRTNRTLHTGVPSLTPAPCPLT